MTDPISRAFVSAFQRGDVEQASSLLVDLPEHNDLRAHPLLRVCVSGQQGHCHRNAQLAIAELLMPAEVIAWRDAIVGDQFAEVQHSLRTRPPIVRAELVAGRGIAQAIHHWKSVEVGKLLLDAGADINALNSVHDGETPLALQVRLGSLEGVRMLLKRGADPNLRPSMHIASESMQETIKLLPTHGWDIQRGHQLLHDANHGLGKRIATWLERGVDPNCQAEDGSTALHLLAAKGKGRAAIRALAKAGADLNLPNKAGQSPLEIARMAKRKSAAEELLSLGAKES